MTLDVKGVGVRFGGVVALDDASISLPRGRLLAVIGPNGSGKSTLFNAITGMVALAAGSIQLAGEDIGGLSAQARVARGLARTFQTPRFDPFETVENAVMCGFYPTAKAGLASVLLRLPNAVREERAMRDRCRTILSDLGLLAYRGLTMGELPMGHVRLVEVARAIANEPHFLLVDEPAAGLTRAEQAVLVQELRRLADRGVGVLLVEHNFGMVRQLAEEVLVLDRGKTLMRGAPQSVEKDPRFVAAYLGSGAVTTNQAEMSS